MVWQFWVGTVLQQQADDLVESALRGCHHRRRPVLHALVRRGPCVEECPDDGHVPCLCSHEHRLHTPATDLLGSLHALLQQPPDPVLVARATRRGELLRRCGRVAEAGAVIGVLRGATLVRRQCAGNCGGPHDSIPASRWQANEGGSSAGRQIPWPKSLQQRCGSNRKRTHPEFRHPRAGNGHPGSPKTDHREQRNAGGRSLVS
mmetsp:Transcript_73144/g.237903  ORF Transcript_73144/g.237903 Transcript_73144/m.237903 type:complete len:204 (+) Transcript_73144:682-1293(+)